MSHQPFGARPVPSALTGLDFGLRVRVELHSTQRAIFSGAENLSAEALTAELAQMISGLRVYSYALRARLEQLTYALQANVESRSWSYARRAALDLSSLLGLLRRKRLAHPERCRRGEHCAERIAELCLEEVR